MVSRSEKKLKFVAQNYLSLYESLSQEIRIIPANFAQNANMAFYDNIMEQVKDIDIGLVVLNAGILNYGKFLDKKGTDV